MQRCARQGSRRAARPRLSGFKLSEHLTFRCWGAQRLTTVPGRDGLKFADGMGFALIYDAMHKMVRLLIFVALAALASPAFAAGEGIQLPEAPNILLFALGILGVMIGRRAASRRPDNDPD